MRKLRSNEGFTLIELLIVVSIIAVIAALAVPGLMRARMTGNEASAIGSVRAINSGEATYASACGGGGYATSLEDLAAEPTSGGSGFISPDLNANDIVKSSYRFSVAVGADDQEVLGDDLTCNGTVSSATFFTAATPIESESGRAFGSDQRGTIFQNMDGAAFDDADSLSDGLTLQ